MFIANGTVVAEVETSWHKENKRIPMKGVVISQTQHEDTVVVRWEGGMVGEWEENTYRLISLEESPLVDGTRAYS